jgi:deazaflavin-dependent oxidoreductase (nitroreductase family)
MIGPMAKTYSPNRAVNAICALLTRLGWGKAYRHLLTVRGRKTGRRYSVPVDVMTVDGRRYLVAAYGEVSWVSNVRATGEASLSRRGRERHVRLRELDPRESIRVLRTYYQEVPVTRPYFDVTADATDAEFEAEARRHPVFEILDAPRLNPRPGPGAGR